MEIMIWSGPFATSWDLAFGSPFATSLVLVFGFDSSRWSARWRWGSAFGRDSCFVCARWRFLPKWLVVARPPRPIGRAERRVVVPLPGPVLGPEQFGVYCP